MKNILKYVFCVLCCLHITMSLIAQNENYYYYKGVQIPLEINIEMFTIIAQDDFTMGKDSKLSKLTCGEIHLPYCGGDYGGGSKGSFRRYDVITPKEIKNEEDYWLEINKLKFKKGVIDVTPSYKYNNLRLTLNNQFYVKLFNSNDYDILRKEAAKYNINIISKLRSTNWYVLSFEQASKYNALKLANIFFETGFFNSVEPDFLIEEESMESNFHLLRKEYFDPIKTSTILDPLYENQWYLKNTGQYGGIAGIDINIEDAWGITKGNNNVVVAVFDTGIELCHPDLDDNILNDGYNANCDFSPADLLNGHGTTVAGIIAAEHNEEGIAGIAPDSKYIPISKYSGGFNIPNSTAGQIVNGFYYATDNNIDVINCSWFSTPSSLIDDAIDYALTNGRSGKGLVIVFASGNFNQNQVTSPGNGNDLIIVVGGISQCGERFNFYSCDGLSTMPSKGSDYGQKLDIVAPGAEILTTGLSSEGYSYVEHQIGTSLAAPMVSGVVALMLSVNPDLTVKQVGDIIEKTAQKVRPIDYDYEYTTGRENGTWNIEMGYGLVDAYQAVLLAQDYALCPTNNFIITDDVAYPHNDVRMAGQTLIANNNVASDATALYTAKDYVLLDTDFFAEAGSHFSAFIQDCEVVSAGSTLQQDYLSKKLDDEDFIIVENNIDNLKVYPNPSSGSISLRLDSGIDFIKIYDFSGKVIFTQSKKNQKELNINIKEKGLYMVEVNSKDKMVFKKVVIQ